MVQRSDLHALEEAFRRTNRRLTVEWNRQFDRHISKPRVMLLERLAAGGPQNVSSLAAALSVTAGAITGLADKLIEAGWVVRRLGEEDRRVVQLEITDSGLELLGTLIAQRKSFIEHALSGIPDEDVHHLIRVLRQIGDNLEPLEDEPGEVSGRQ